MGAGIRVQGPFPTSRRNLRRLGLVLDRTLVPVRLAKPLP